MAPRRPKNPINDAGAWLGGVGKAVRGFTSKNPLIDPVGFARNVKASPTQAAKQVAADLALAAVGGVVGKGVQVGGRALARTGVPARAVNKVTGKTVVVHGSATKNLKMIEPRVAPARPEVGAKVFASRPTKTVVPYDMEAISRTARHYVAERAAGIAAKQGKPITRYEGSVYVAKVPKKSLEGNAFVTSPVPAKVVKELPIYGPMPYKHSDLPIEDVKKLERAFRQAGGVPLKGPKQPKVKIPKNRGPVRS